MNLTDLDIGKLIEVIGLALVPIIFEGVNKDMPAHALRARARLNAEIMGRVAAVLYCGNRVGPDIAAKIELFTQHMCKAHLDAFNEVLGPEGHLSRAD
ncbi:hypothetical protein [Pseudomonas plecoglossicida]|uniref:hypothetical protein n=1 Tax=Pseudomonas plecoglossicida TaxID=70775 RepID=UPI00049182CD|nr:hypothetical protein [Pseudomonas plecoglossicida]GLR37673.1 hypothetical protein GCM10011247_30710 [Pseudomonas plecoglossicida]